MFPAGSRYVPGRVPICSRPGPDFSRDLIGNISGFFGQNREHIGVFRDFLLSMWAIYSSGELWQPCALFGRQAALRTDLLTRLPKHYSTPHQNNGRRAASRAFKVHIACTIVICILAYSTENRKLQILSNHVSSKTRP